MRFDLLGCYLRKVLEDFSEDDAELIAAGFPLYKGGKVPDPEYVAKNSGGS